MKNLWNAEPVAILGVVQTALALLLAFGVALTTEQTGAILAITAAILTIIARQTVTPPANLPPAPPPDPEV